MEREQRIRVGVSWLTQNGAEVTSDDEFLHNKLMPGRGILGSTPPKLKSVV